MRSFCGVMQSVDTQVSSQKFLLNPLVVMHDYLSRDNQHDEKNLIVNALVTPTSPRNQSLDNHKSIPKAQHPYTYVIVIYICREQKKYKKLWFFCFIAFLVTFDSREKVHKFCPIPTNFHDYRNKSRMLMDTFVASIFPELFDLLFSTLASRFLSTEWKIFWAHRKTFQFSQQNKKKFTQFFLFFSSPQSKIEFNFCSCTVLTFCVL